MSVSKQEAGCPLCGSKMAGMLLGRCLEYMREGQPAHVFHWPSTTDEMRSRMVPDPAQSKPTREPEVAEAMRRLLAWLEDDTLEIMKDTIKMGITFDWKDCQLLREQIEIAGKSLAEYDAARVRGEKG